MKIIPVAFLLLGFCAWASATYRPIYCKRPSIPFKTKLAPYKYIRGFPAGTLLKFYCHDGYELVGSSYSKCNEYGAWQPKLPTCVRKVTCGPRNAPANGRVDPKQNKYNVGAKIRFTCRTDYYLKGISEDTCKSNGKWAVGGTPTCTKRCFIKDVSDLLIFDQRPFYEPGDEVDFECKKPYELVGDDDFECQNDGTWDPEEFPVCVNTCRLPDIENGGVEDAKDVYLAGERIEYFCNKGYRITVATDAQCLRNGQWSKIAVCRPEIKKCKGHHIAFGTVRPKQDWHASGAKIAYHCNEGYRLDGKSDTNKCKSDGTWVYPIPSCKKRPHGDSCRGRCSDRPDYRSYTCHCSSHCVLYKNCCSDYRKYCGNYYKPLY